MAQVERITVLVQRDVAEEAKESILSALEQDGIVARIEE